MEVINIDHDYEFVLDTQAKEVEININKCRVVITDVSDANKHIVVNDGVLDYCYIKKGNQSIVNNTIVNKGSVDIRVIDISNNESKNNYVLALDSEGSNVNFTVASISKEHSKKDYTISTRNNNVHTTSRIDCFGIVEDDSYLKYDINSFIKKGAKKSSVNQASKILLFDKESMGINNPILEIEENDVKANHGSSIGMIDEETLFYLTSRGIKEEDARRLVSLGKINYIIEEVRNEKLKQELLNGMMEV